MIKEHQFNIYRHTHIISSSSFNLYLQVALLDQKNLVDPAEIGKEFVVVVQIIIQAISCQGLTNSETFQLERPQNTLWLLQVAKIKHCTQINNRCTI